MTTKEALDEIARPIFPTLEEDGLDHLDFADISKATLRGMLEAAYARGLAEAAEDCRNLHYTERT